MNLVVAAVLGIAIAFIGSMPIAGPLAVLVLERAVSGKRAEGLFIAFGGALAEAVVAFVVALLFPLLFALSHVVVTVSRIAGAAIVGTIGLVLFVHPDVVKTPPTSRRSGSFITGLVLSGVNPTLVATWTVVVATLNSHGLLGRSAAAASFFGLGVGAGVAGWFSLLVLLSGKAQEYMQGRRRTQTIRILGLILVCAGGYLIFRSMHESGVPA
ncbi:MAG TPA: LysE family transporter [Polyangiaceae bacterium]|nr:LysE family transporter [Polyangiaceae bacterium]